MQAQGHHLTPAHQLMAITPLSWSLAQRTVHFLAIHLMSQAIVFKQQTQQETRFWDAVGLLHDRLHVTILRSHLAITTECGCEIEA